MQIELCLNVESFTTVLPAGIPGYEKQDSTALNQDPMDFGLGKGVILATPDLKLYLRLHDHLMGMANLTLRRFCCLPYLSQR